MKKRVVVLGGGIGGMTAAHELIERGFDVEVHEMKKVAGGKARTIYVEGTGEGGRPDLPGEHGFRFFPGFYKHIPDTMKRIPFRGNPRGVFDGLVQGTQSLVAVTPENEFVFLARFPESIAEWADLVRTYFDAQKLGIPDHELEFFVDRLLLILTTCQERRLAEYEKITWWQFIEAEGKSDAYKRYLATGLTRTLVALKAEIASTRTVGNIFLQLLLDVYAPLVEDDRLLDGPTTETWLDPWLDHLKSSGVRYHTDSKVIEVRCAGNRITGVTVESSGGERSEVTADWYVMALPVEQFAPLVTGAMKAADPALGRLEDLEVAWMNGIQFYLKRDHTLVHGHTNFVSTPSALTSISQEQFFRRSLTTYGDGEARGCLSVDISDWESPGIVYGKPLKQLENPEQVMREVQAQIKASLRPELASVVDDDNIVRWFLDPDIEFPNGSPVVNLEPLLINTAGSWQNRPEAVTHVENLFLASDYVRTFTDLATMEGANEAARRAVNGILMASGSTAPLCRLWPLEEPLVFLPAREYDFIRFKLGLPHARGAVVPEPAPPPPPPKLAPLAQPHVGAPRSPAAPDVAFDMPPAFIASDAQAQGAATRGPVRRTVTVGEMMALKGDK